MTVNWRPAPGWLIVEPVETTETVGAGSVIVPVQVRDRLTRWQYTVLASGGPPLPALDSFGQLDEEVRTYRDFQPGDWVMAPPRSTLDSDEERLLLLPLEAVWGVIA